MTNQTLLCEARVPCIEVRDSMGSMLRTERRPAVGVRHSIDVRGNPRTQLLCAECAAIIDLIEFKGDTWRPLKP